MSATVDKSKSQRSLTFLRLPSGSSVFPIVIAASAVILHLRVGGIASASMFAHAQIALLFGGFLMAGPVVGSSWWLLNVLQ